jgi:phosphopentomutase
VTVRRRFVFLVLDGVGVGALPDAADYGDTGSDTLGNLSRLLPLTLPHLERLGLGNIAPLPGVPPAQTPLALAGRLACRSAGKDTTVGHWEHMGLVTARPFPTYPYGFPEEVIGPFTRAIGREVLGNKTASGTAIIDELGKQHLATGRPIVYTSADSVFQVAAHVDIVPLETLYSWCQTARALLQGQHAVARVIARPFSGKPGAFVRTKDRRDFSLAPTGPTYLDELAEAGVPVLALGKVSEIFGGRGVTTVAKVGSNAENLALVRALLERRGPVATFTEGLLFTNLVDFDMVWGHRNDVDGFAEGLRAVDAALPGILAALGPGDRLLLTADHGVDPTTPSTDHSREYAPLLLYPRPQAAPPAVYEGFFADTGATAYRHLARRPPALAGDVIDDLRPSRGWRPYPAVLADPAPGGSRVRLPWGPLEPVRAGPQEAAEAADWLHHRFGPAPEVGLVLGSGLSSCVEQTPLERVPFARIPHWRAGSVPGHPYALVLVEWGGRTLVVLEGRLHGYEGFDEGEIQLPVRTLAAWGATRVVVTSAAGAVAPDIRPGDVVLATEVLDFRHLLADGAPLPLGASGAGLMEWLQGPQGRPRDSAGNAGRARLLGGVHACVPGPHYETAAELAVLRRLGVATVSMSLASEIVAATETGLEAVALAAAVNAGDTSHQEVLSGALAAAAGVGWVVTALLSLWEG